MRNLKTLLVALVMLLCLALPFGALASGDAGELPTITEEALLAAVPSGVTELSRFVYGESPIGFTQSADVMADDGTEHVINYTVESYRITAVEYNLTVFVAAPNLDVNLAVSEITVPMTAQRADALTDVSWYFGSSSTPPATEYTYGTTYEDLNADEEAEAVAQYKEAGAAYGYTFAGYEGTGVISADARQGKVLYTVDETSDYWTTHKEPTEQVAMLVDFVCNGKAELNITFPDSFSKRALNEAYEEPTVEGLVGNDTITWLYDGSNELPILPGEYAIAYRLINADYYDLSGVTFPTTLVIEKAPLTLVDSDVTLTYNGEKQEINLSWEGLAANLPAGPSVTVTYADASGATVDAPKNAGEYTATVTLENDPYYTMDETVINITIARADVNPVIGAAPAAFTNKDMINEVLDSISFEGVVNGENPIGIVDSPSEMIHAGEYTFVFGYVDPDAENNYNLVTDTLTYTITAAPVTISIVDKTVVLGGSCWPFNGQEQAAVLGTDYTVDNAIEGVTYAFNLVAESFDGAVLKDGTYTIGYDALIGYGSDSDDLSITINNGSLEVCYAALDTTLTPSGPAVSGNQWHSDVTFTPVAGLEMTMDRGATWQASFTPAEDTLETSVTYQVRDAVTGHVSAPATLVYALDTEYPEYYNLKVGKQPAQKVNAVIGEITDNLGLAKIECDELSWSQELSGNSVTNLALPEITENGVYWFYIYDGAGLNIGVAISVEWIDTTAPTVKFSTPGTELTTAEEITFMTDDGVDEGCSENYVADPVVVITGPAGEVYNGATGLDTVELTYNGTYNWSVTDAAGNSKTGSFDITTIDTIAPELMVAYEGNITNSGVLIEIEANDVAADDAMALAGLESTYTIYMNGEVITGSQTVTENGTYVIYAEDNVGNTTEEVTAEITCIDTTAPVVASWEVSTDTSAQTAEVTITITDAADEGAADDVAGVDEVLVLSANGDEYNVTLENGVGKFTAKCNCGYLIDGYDRAGNALLPNIEYFVNVLDTASPKISVITPDYTNETPVNAAYNLTFTVTDAHKDDCNHEHTAGSTLTVYCNGEEIATTTEGSIEVVKEVAANGTYTFTAKDTAGNEADAVSYIVSNLDMVAPELTNLEASTTEPTNEEVTLTFEVSDPVTSGTGLDGVKSITYAFNGNEVGELTEGKLEVANNGEYTFTVTDYAGNTDTESIVVDNIDIDPPTLDVEGYETTDPVSGTVKLLFAASDNGSDQDGNATADGKCGVDYILVKHDSFDADKKLAADATELEVAYNGVYTIEVYDLAGNMIDGTIEVDNIDVAAPTLKISADVNPADPTNGKVEVFLTASDSGVDGAGNFTNDQKCGIATIVISHDSYNKETVLDMKNAHAGEVSFDALYNGTYTINVIDQAGNAVSDTIDVDNIDQVDPTIEIAAEVAPATPVSGTVDISFTTGDEGADEKDNATGEANYGVASIVVSHESFEEDLELDVAAEKVTVAYNGLYTFIVTDKAGNQVTSEIEVTNIDVVAPTFEYEKTTPAEPTPNDVVISFVAGDEGADPKEGATGEEFFGIASIVVSHDSFEEPMELDVDAAEVTVSYNGTYTFTVTDLAGNSVTKEVEVDNIDVVYPTIEIEAEVDPATPVSGTVDISYVAGDLGADVKENLTGEANFGLASVVLSHEFFEEDQELDLTATKVTVDYNGVYTFTVTDLAGNVTTDTIEVFNIDVVKPTFEHVENDPADPTNGDVTIHFTTDDEGTDPKEGATDEEFFGVDYILVNHDSFDEAVELAADEESLVVNANGIYTFTVVDLAGNSEDFTVEVNNIDHTAPVADYSYEKVYHTSADGVKITLTTTDPGEDNLGLSAAAENYGLASVQVTFNGKTVDLPLGADDKNVTAEYTATADGLYTFTFTDKGGNVTTKTLDLIYIDDIAPTVSARFVGTRLRIAVADSERLAYFEIAHRKADNVIETVETYYGQTEVPDHVYRALEPGYYYVIVYDEAGNSAETRVYNYDRDEDGVSDAREAELGTDPDVADTDDDGLTDGEEVRRRTDPLDPDSDGDGLTDGQEVGMNSNPNSADSDNDGVNDYVAYQMGMLGGENQFFGAASILIGGAYTPNGSTVEPGRFADMDEATAMLNGLESAGLANGVETSDFDTVKKTLSKAVKKTNGIVVQFDANEAEGLAVVGNYLMQFNRQKNQFVASKGYDMAEMLGSEEFIVLSNADGSTVLVAPWSEAEQKATGDLMVLSLTADRAVKLTGTAGASHLAISASGESIAYNKDGNVIVLNLAKGESTSSPVVDLAGLTFVGEMPVSVLNSKAAWGMENGEWKEVDFTNKKDVVLDMAQRTNNYRKVLLPGVEMTELEINIQVEVIMNRGDITAKTDEMKRSVTMYDLSKAE